MTVSFSTDAYHESDRLKQLSSYPASFAGLENFGRYLRQVLKYRELSGGERALVEEIQSYFYDMFEEEF